MSPVDVRSRASGGRSISGSTYRLQAIDGFGWFLEALLQKKGPPVFVQVTDGAIQWTATTNALVDAGLAHGRALMEFLGISRDRHGKLKPAERDPARKRDDLWPADLDLNDVPLAGALRIGPWNVSATRAALIRFHEIASKGIAHLTITSRRADVVRLDRATLILRRLTEAYVYDKLGREWNPRDFDSPFRHPVKVARL